MERWVLYALLSMGFAGFTAVIAKIGLSNITGELGLTVRTIFVSAFVLLFAVFMVIRAVSYNPLAQYLVAGCIRCRDRPIMDFLL